MPDNLPTHPEALLSIDQVAALIGVETKTIRRWRRVRRIPTPIKLNGQLRWRLQTITEWIRRQEVESEVRERFRIEKKEEKKKVE